MLQVFLFNMYLSVEICVGGVSCLMYGWMWCVCRGLGVWVHVLLGSMYMGLVVGCSGVVVWKVWLVCADVSSVGGGIQVVTVGVHA